MTGEIIKLTQYEADLLNMYAFPFISKIPPERPQGDNGNFGTLVQAGLVREGVGYAIDPFGENIHKITGKESEAQFAKLIKPTLKEVPGWVVTEKAIAHILEPLEGDTRQKTEFLLRRVIADKDPAGPYVPGPVN